MQILNRGFNIVSAGDVIGSMRAALCSKVQPIHPNLSSLLEEQGSVRNGFIEMSTAVR